MGRLCGNARNPHLRILKHHIQNTDCVKDKRDKICIFDRFTIENYDLCSVNNLNTANCFEFFSIKAIPQDYWNISLLRPQ